MKRVAHVNCTCKHDFQDKEHKGKRVANLMDKSIKSGSNQVEVKCTVCAKTHTVNVGQLI